MYALGMKSAGRRSAVSGFPGTLCLPHRLPFLLLLLLLLPQK